MSNFVANWKPYQGYHAELMQGLSKDAPKYCGYIWEEAYDQPDGSEPVEMFFYNGFSNWAEVVIMGDDEPGYYTVAASLSFKHGQVNFWKRFKTYEKSDAYTQAEYVAELISDPETRLDAILYMLYENFESNSMWSGVQHLPK